MTICTTVWERPIQFVNIFAVRSLIPNLHGNVHMTTTPLEITQNTPRELKMLGERPTVHPSSDIRESELGAWTDIGPNCTISESTIGDYTYCAGDASIIYSTIGKFCSIASHVRSTPATTRCTASRNIT